MNLGGVRLQKSDRRYGKAEKKLTLSLFDLGEEQAQEFLAYVDKGDHILVPRDYGHLLRLDGAELCEGARMPRKAMRPVKLKGYQHPWVDEVVSYYGEVPDVRAQAGTGKGKTIMSLEVARRLRRATLVVVDQEFLRDQWIERAMDEKLFGMDRELIGIVQGKKCEYEGKALVVAMIQSLYQKKYPKEFWRHFGLSVFDESHVVGAPQFSSVLFQTPSMMRLYVSATPDRRDELDKVLHFHGGPVRLHLQSEHAKSVVRYIRHPGCYSWYANSSPKTGRYLSEITTDGPRNMMLADVIKRMSESDRNILVVSERIEHLENLIALCKYLGVPGEDMGLVTGHHTVWGYSKELKPKRRPYGYVRGTEYTPIKFGLIRKRTPKKLLAQIKEEKRILFATYSMFEKGVDVPRLDSGIDCTPRNRAEQQHGRILREGEGKMVPVWVTIRDTLSYRAEHQFLNRLAEYQKSNAEVYEWNLQRGVRKMDVAELKARVRQKHVELKAAEIITKLDGNYTVMMRGTGPRPKRQPEKHTAARTRRRATH